VAVVQAVQLKLVSFGYALPVDGIYGPKTVKAVLHWQKANGLYVDGVIGDRTLESMGIGTGAWASAPAVRTSPPSPPPVTGTGAGPGALTGCDKANYYRVQAGLPQVFQEIAYGESRCNNGDNIVSNTGCCVGALQIHTGNFTAPGYRAGVAACGVHVRSDITGDDDASWTAQYCVAKVLYDVWLSGGSRWPWAPHPHP